MQFYERRKPAYQAAKEVDQATLEERQVNFYKVQQEEMAAKKREQQRRYKEELDRHLAHRENMRVKGKMTGVEKAFNKDDLLAYKHFDTA